MRASSPDRGTFDQGDALGWITESGNPLPQPEQVGVRQGHRGQDGEHVVERQAAHRHSP
jgi:hypothetical protein